ncbi:MAG TPA: DUF6371 domain-containing protein [Bacteroidales bacterium]|nr:DUF6371 domain-containing protein [Bacteroidales bacterium]
MYKYTLTNARRTDCPHCGKRGKYSAYMDTMTNMLAPLQYGMCSSCGVYVIPPDNCMLEDEATVPGRFDGLYCDADTIDWNEYRHFHNSKGVENSFLLGLVQRFGVDRVKHVYDLYKLGRFDDDGIMFPYLYTDDHICSVKIMWYDGDLHRVKEGRKQHPHWLHNLVYKNDKGYVTDYRNLEADDDGNEFVSYKLKLCLFGHNQIVNEQEKTICLVESEKTAIIMSMVFPDFIWLASGGKTLIQDYKFTFFTGRRCLVFPDLSEDNNVWNYWVKKMTYYSMSLECDFVFIDYFSGFLQKDRELIGKVKSLSFDPADFVLDFNDGGCYTTWLKNQINK